jgi:hypothetical protein
MNALFANLGKQGSQTLQVLDLMKASSAELAGVAGRELSMVTESASGKYRRALEGLKADLASMGEEFLKVQTFFINVTDGILKFINKLPAPIKTILTFVTGLTAIIGPVIMLTGVLANFFGYIIKGASHFRSLFKGGEGWKMLTPEILAAQKAGSLVETTFYSDAKAATVLKTAISGLVTEFELLQSKAMTGAISAGPAISTMAGNIVTPGIGRVVNPNHPLISAEDTRSMSHLNPVAGMSTDARAAQTIFGVVPGAPKVNQKIGNNPQMYMSGDLPKIQGLTSIGGASTGIVAEEAAKWHAMTGALAMQSQAEIALLKKEVANTGLITASLSDSYQALLPTMTKLTANAAAESAAIVAELQTGKLTVDQARAKIITLNAQVESMIAQASVDIAGQQGRSIGLTTVPLLNQPVVNKDGKTNMKELTRPGRTRDLLNKIARGLGVKTFGAPYSTETTMPRRLNSGGKVFYNNGDEVPGPNVNADVVPAMLTPGEFVIRRDVAQQDPEGMRALNNGEATIVQNRFAGGAILNTLSRLGAWNRSRAVSARRIYDSGANPSTRKFAEDANYGPEPYSSMERRNSIFWRNPLLKPGQRKQGEVLAHVITSKFLRRFKGFRMQGSAPVMTGAQMQNKFGAAPSGNSANKEYQVLPDNVINVPESFNKSLANGTATGAMWLSSGRKPQHFISLISHLLNAGVPYKVAYRVASKTLSRVDKAMLSLKDTNLSETKWGNIVDSAMDLEMQALQSSYNTAAKYSFNRGGMVPGYAGGGIIPNVLKSTAFKNLGARFGKIGESWGATSMSIGMGRKLFGSSGLTPKAQNLMYGKLIEHLEKERPYGYVKDAQGSLQKALEPNIVDALLKSAAGDVLSTGGKSLSKIDREILRTKFADWNSKSWTPATTKVRKQMFGMNQGGMVPGYRFGGLAARYAAARSTVRGSGTLRAPKLDANGKPLAPKLDANGKPIEVDPNSGMASSMAGMGLMMAGQALPGAVGQGMSIAGLVMQMAPLLPMLTKAKNAISGMGGAFSMLSKIGPKLLISLRMGFAALMGPVGLVSIALGGLFILWKKNNERIKENAKEQTMLHAVTEKGAKQAGIAYNNISDSIKNVKDQLELAKAASENAFNAQNSSGVAGLTLTIEELKNKIKAAKTEMSEFVDVLNKMDQGTAKNNKMTLDLAANWKATWVAGGKSAQDATNEIYAIIKASDQANHAFEAITSGGFKSITDRASALSYMFKDLNTNMTKMSGEDLGNALGNLVVGLDNAVDALAATKDESGNQLGHAKAMEETLKNINSIEGASTKLNQEQIDSLKETYPALAKILNTSDDIKTVYSKWRLLVAGIDVDLKKLTGSQAATLAQFIQLEEEMISAAETATKDQDNYIETVSKSGAVVKRLNDQIAKGSVEAQKAAQKTKDDLDAEIKLIDKRMKKYQEEADARIKAIQKTQNAESYAVELKQAQLDLQSAIASGDKEAQVRAQLALSALQKRHESEMSIAAIQDDVAEKDKANNEEKKRIQDAKDKLDKTTSSAQSKAANTTVVRDQVVGFQQQYEGLLKRQGFNDKRAKDDPLKYSEGLTISKDLSTLANAISKGAKGKDKDLAKALKDAFGGTLIDSKTSDSLGGKVTQSYNGISMSSSYQTGLADIQLKSDSKAMVDLITISNSHLSNIEKLLGGKEGSGSFKDPKTVSEVPVYDTMSQKSVNKNGELTDQAREDLIRRNKYQKNTYFEYGGKKYRVNNGFDNKMFHTPGAVVVSKALGGPFAAGQLIEVNDRINPLGAQEEGIRIKPDFSGIIYPNAATMPRYDIPSGGYRGSTTTSSSGSVGNSPVINNYITAAPNMDIKQLAREVGMVTAKAVSRGGNNRGYSNGTQQVVNV